jgi:hypothetical protein
MDDKSVDGELVGVGHLLTHMGGRRSSLVLDVCWSSSVLDVSSSEAVEALVRRERLMVEDTLSVGGDLVVGGDTGFVSVLGIGLGLEIAEC